MLQLHHDQKKLSRGRARDRWGLQQRRRRGTVGQGNGLLRDPAITLSHLYHRRSAYAFDQRLQRTVEDARRASTQSDFYFRYHGAPQSAANGAEPLSKFLLQKISSQRIYERLETVLKAEEISYEEKALRVIAQGRGSMRDALTFLDKIIAIGGGKADWEALSQVLTNLSALPYIKLLFALVQMNSNVCLDVIEKLDQRGVEFRKGGLRGRRACKTRLYD